MVGAAQEELTHALEELRELARGIHPAVLSDRGLQAAVEALAVRSPLPVKVVEVPGERLPEPVEAAAYFVIAEALTNVAKYANANDGHGGGPPGQRARRGRSARRWCRRRGSRPWIGPARPRRPGRRTGRFTGTRLATRVGHYSPSGDSRMSTAETPLKVVVAEDSVLLREGLVRLLEDSGFEVAGQAGDAEDLLRKVGAHKPDVAVIDVRMPPQPHRRGPARRAQDPRRAPRHRRARALASTSRRPTRSTCCRSRPSRTGYLLKDRVADVDTFTDAVRRVAGGGSRAGSRGRGPAARPPPP